MEATSRRGGHPKCVGFGEGNGAIWSSPCLVTTNDGEKDAVMKKNQLIG